jgi:hypothetical protein
MTTAIFRRAPIAPPSEEVTPDRWHNPAYQAFWLLRIGAATLARMAVVLDRPGLVGRHR